jgi:hypothetical protein
MLRPRGRLENFQGSVLSSRPETYVARYASPLTLATDTDTGVVHRSTPDSLTAIILDLRAKRASQRCAESFNLLVGVQR